MKPSDIYQQQLELTHVELNPRQQALVEAFDRLHQELQGVRPRGALSGWFGKSGPVATGLYIWGSTGVGKTWLMDIFYQSLGQIPRRREHFASFMQDIHLRLASLPRTPDPLKRIAREISQTARVLCLDEFHVDDITDAMILTGLLQALFTDGVVLVTTSNIGVTELYRNGLQRDRFLPAISLLQDNLQIFQLQGDEDYRKRMLAQEGVYHVTTDRQIANELLEHNFSTATGNVQWQTAPLHVNGREIAVIAAANKVLWIDFVQLCATFRSSADYIRLAYDFELVLIGHIPVLQDGQNDMVQRFINFVDAMYDHKVKLIVSAESEPETLYQGRSLAFPFQRTASRLIEMRSRAYLMTNHLAA